MGSTDPAGKVSRFTQVLEEDRPGANLSPAAAAAMAQAFLQGVMRVDLSAYERLEASSAKHATPSELTAVARYFQA